MAIVFVVDKVSMHSYIITFPLVCITAYVRGVISIWRNGFRFSVLYAHSVRPKMRILNCCANGPLFEHRFGNGCVPWFLNFIHTSSLSPVICSKMWVPGPNVSIPRLTPCNPQYKTFRLCRICRRPSQWNWYLGMMEVPLSDVTKRIYYSGLAILAFADLCIAVALCLLLLRARRNSVRRWGNPPESSREGSWQIYV